MKNNRKNMNNTYTLYMYTAHRAGKKSKKKKNVKQYKITKKIVEKICITDRDTISCRNRINSPIALIIFFRNIITIQDMWICG